MQTWHSPPGSLCKIRLGLDGGPPSPRIMNDDQIFTDDLVAAAVDSQVRSWTINRRVESWWGSDSPGAYFLNVYFEYASLDLQKIPSQHWVVYHQVQLEYSKKPFILIL